MREFWVRLVSMLAIVGVLLGYNSVLDVRAKEDEIARLSAQVAGNGQSDSEMEVPQTTRTEPIPGKLMDLAERSR